MVKYIQLHIYIYPPISSYYWNCTPREGYVILPQMRKNKTYCNLDGRSDEARDCPQPVLKTFKTKPIWNMRSASFWRATALRLDLFNRTNSGTTFEHPKVTVWSPWFVKDWSQLILGTPLRFLLSWYSFLLVVFCHVMSQNLCTYIPQRISELVQYISIFVTQIRFLF